MKPATALAALAVILSIAASAHAANYYSIRNQLISARRRRSDEKTKTLFEEWAARRGKIYSQIGEKDRRFEVFKDNLKFVESHNGNNGNRSFRLGLNKFADLTSEEYRAAYSGATRRGDAARRFVMPPEFVDRRDREGFPPVKYRRTCDGYENVPRNEKALQTALTHQPISVAIEVSGRALQLYSSGVFTGECGVNLDHGVVVVGYGSESGLDYWTVKNSWGSDWGENGYLKLERNVGSPYGKCGIVMEACYTIKKGEASADSDTANGYHAAE